MSDQQYTQDDIDAVLNGDPIEENDVEEETAPVEEGDEENLEAEDSEPEQDDEEVEEFEEDDLELKMRKLQAAKDREIESLRSEYYKLKEEMAERRGAEQAMQQAVEAQNSQANASVTLEDLHYGIQTNLPATFEWAVTTRPDLVPQLVSLVRADENFGHPVADQMVVEYNQFLQHQTLAQQQEMYNQILQQRELDAAPLRNQQEMENVVGDLTDRFGDNFTAMKDDIAQVLNTDGRDYIEYLRGEAIANGEDPNSVVTPQLMRDMMIDIYLEMRENSLNATTSAPQKPSSVPAGAAALGGKSSGGNVDSTDEDFIKSMIQGAQESYLRVDPSFLP